MNVETKFLNKEAVLDYMNWLVHNGHMSVAPGMVMADIGEEFARICRDFYLDGSVPCESTLTIYQNFTPDDAQLRRALDRLMNLTYIESAKCYRFHTPRQWLAVYKVFQFLHLIGNGHGSIAKMERMIARIYQGDTPRIPCRQDDISKKNTCKPFNASLQVWEQKRRESNMESYWQIALYLLQFIKEECGNKCGNLGEVPK
jgi:hypothetical protein